MDHSYDRSGERKDGSDLGSSFAGLDAEDIDVHCRIKLYGDFILTDAIRPSYDVAVRPEAGFRIEKFTEEETGETTPITIAAVSAPEIMPVLQHLLQHLALQGDSLVIVNLFSIRDSVYDERSVVSFRGIDLPVLTSLIREYSDLILNDGYMGISISAPDLSWELVLDEHKLFNFYGDPVLITPVLQANGIDFKPEMQFITEAEHLHATSESFEQQYDHLVALVRGRSRGSEPW